MNRSVCGAVVAGAITSLLCAQSAPIPAPAAIRKFEAASIRPGCDLGTGKGGGGTAIPASSPGRLSTCRSLLSPFKERQDGLIQEAYGSYANGRTNPPWAVPPIEGGPGWLTTDPYYISARAPGDPVSIEMMRGPMMQALLEDRFKLKVHRETRPGLVYELVVAKGGPKLMPFKGSCMALDFAKPAGLQPAPPAGQRPCDVRRVRNPSSIAIEIVSAQGVSLEWLAYALHADRPVVDKTGLSGLFDIDLEYEPDRAMFPPPPPPPGAITPETTREDQSNQPPGLSIFAALQEELGLRLEPGRGTREVLIIDSVARPSDN